MKSKPKALCVAENGMLSSDGTQDSFFSNKLIKTSFVFPLMKEIILWYLDPFTWKMQKNRKRRDKTLSFHVEFESWKYRISKFIYL